MITLDLCREGKLSKKHMGRLQDIMKRNTSVFVDFIERVSEPYADNLDWWVESPASRNLINSSLYYNLCCIQFFKEIIELEDIGYVLVESLKLKKILESVVTLKQIEVNVRCTEKNSLSRDIKNISIFFVRELIRNIIFLACGKKNHKINNDEEIIIIDKFVTPGSEFIERYYCRLLDYIDVEVKKNIYFVPTLTGYFLSRYPAAFSILRENEQQYLFKEDYLCLSDYVFALMHLIRLRNISIKNASFLGVDVSELIKEELHSVKNTSSSHIALLNYCFFKRLKKNNIKIRRIVSWFENQVVDKGWNAGIRDNYPDVENVGYQGFADISPMHQNIYPTNLEKKLKIIPKTIAVIGEAYKDEVVKFCSDINVIVAPAFRFKWLWNENSNSPNQSHITILIAYALNTRSIVESLVMISKCIDKIDNQKYKWLIKFHPASDVNVLKGLVGEKWNDQFMVVDNHMSDCLSSCDILIGDGASSVCMEALAKGVPVILPIILNGYQFNPFPDRLSDKFYKIINTEDEMIEAIVVLSENKDDYQQCDADDVRDLYFLKPNKENSMRFLGFPIE